MTNSGPLFFLLALWMRLPVHAPGLRTSSFSSSLIFARHFLRTRAFFLCDETMTRAASTRRRTTRSHTAVVAAAGSDGNSKDEHKDSVITTPTTSSSAGQQQELDKSTSNLFLIKSEPHEFSIQQLQKQGREEWDGVRNYAARNHLKGMRVDDRCWFYHSSCKTPAIVGTCRVVRTAMPDATALDPDHAQYDPKSAPPNACRWVSVLVEFEELYETPVTLKELRHQATTNAVVQGMLLLQRSRLSVMPVTEQEWKAVEQLRERKELGDDLLA